MRYALIREMDVTNGNNIGISIFVQGCNFHCKGCFNPETWDFNFGKPFDSEVMNEILEAMQPSYIHGFTLLGGEPFEYVNQQGVLPLLKEMKSRFPNKDIWCFTGYDFEKDILGDMVSKWPETSEMLSYIDVLVDGEFVEAKRNLSLRFRGSENQRLIKVADSLMANEVILWDDSKDFI